VVLAAILILSVHSAVNRVQRCRDGKLWWRHQVPPAKIQHMANGHWYGPLGRHCYSSNL